jgi:hypothetical protein
LPDTKFWFLLWIWHFLSGKLHYFVGLRRKNFFEGKTVMNNGNTNQKKPLRRCDECDRETHYYNVFIKPTNEEKVICWECLGREERGFFAKKDFRRMSRYGVIPR